MRVGMMGRPAWQPGKLGGQINKQESHMAGSMMSACGDLPLWAACFEIACGNVPLWGEDRYF